MRIETILAIGMLLIAPHVSRAQFTMDPDHTPEHEDVTRFIEAPVTPTQLNLISQYYSRALVESHFIDWLIGEYGADYDKTMSNVEIDELRDDFTFGYSATLAAGIVKGSETVESVSALYSEIDCINDCLGSGIWDHCTTGDVLGLSMGGFLAYDLAVLRGLAVGSATLPATAAAAGVVAGCLGGNSLGCHIGCQGVAIESGCGFGEVCMTGGCPNDIPGVSSTDTGLECFQHHGGDLLGVPGRCCVINHTE